MEKEIIEPVKNKTDLEIWLENTKALNLNLIDLEAYIGDSLTCNYNNIYSKLEGFGSEQRAAILFNKWNKKIIEPLPQFKVIESIETITKVENNEGSQFFIGDVVKSESNVIHNIKSFKYNVNNMGILAITEKLPAGISIAKLEHYIEPKVEIRETLLEKAKRLYPIGTVVNNMNICGSDFHTDFTITQECYKFGDKNNITCKSNEDVRSICWDNIWAKIIK